MASFACGLFQTASLLSPPMLITWGDVIERVFEELYSVCRCFHAEMAIISILNISIHIEER